jgi:hypothetical protein
MVRRTSGTHNRYWSEGVKLLPITRSLFAASIVSQKCPAVNDLSTGNASGQGK